MREVPLIDGHNDLPWRVRELTAGDFDSLDIAVHQDSLHTDIPRLREGLVGAQFFVSYVPAELIGNGAARFALMQIDLIKRMVARYPETFLFVTTGDGIQSAHEEGKIAALIGLEGGHAIEGSLDLLRTFYELGVRYMTLTHWASHEWADAATDEPIHGGLSPFGELVVREMNRLGILIDISHVSDSTMMDAMRVSEAPVIYSHSSARALDDHPRNVPDPILQRLAENDGIVMVNYSPTFINQEVRDYEVTQDSLVDSLREAFSTGDSTADSMVIDSVGLREALDRWTENHPAPIATLEQVADHIDHLVQVAGVEHVGFGSDYDGIDVTPKGLEDVSKFPAIVAELLRRGYSDENVKKLLGQNFLRVMREAEVVSARLREEMDPIVATIPPGIDEEEED
jgi:membrane dipeptidase